jgi:hypothetical protein
LSPSSSDGLFSSSTTIYPHAATAGMMQARRARTGLRAGSRGADAELDGVEGGDELGAGQLEATADGSPPRRASGGELHAAWPIHSRSVSKFFSGYTDIPD